MYNFIKNPTEIKKVLAEQYQSKIKQSLKWKMKWPYILRQTLQVMIQNIQSF